jgi:hypothetical protein
MYYGTQVYRLRGKLDEGQFKVNYGIYQRMHEIHQDCLGIGVFGVFVLFGWLIKRKIVVVVVGVNHPMNDPELFYLS